MNPIERALAKADAIIAQDVELDRTLNHVTGAAKAKEGFRSGEDWTFAATGQQTSIRDLEVGTTVLLRYKRHTQVTNITARKNGSYS